MKNSTSRRQFLIRSSSLAAGSPLLTRSAAAAAPSPEDAKTLDRLQKANTDAARRILIKGVTVVSMDAKVGNLPRGDVLIEGDRIKDIAPDLGIAARDGKAIVLDARNSIVFPGFVDPHIHAWEGQLAGIIPNSNGVANDSKRNYFTVMHQTLGPQNRPEDAYVGDPFNGLSLFGT